MPATILFGNPNNQSGQSDQSSQSEATINSTSVSELNVVLTDVELLRLARAQARRRGRRAEKLRCRAADQDRAYRLLGTEFAILRDHRARLERELLRLQAELDKTRRRLDEAPVPSERECVICLDKEANYAFYPCGHVVTCQDCEKAVKDQAKRVNQPLKCPFCKRETITTIKLYFP